MGISRNVQSHRTYSASYRPPVRKLNKPVRGNRQNTFTRGNPTKGSWNPFDKRRNGRNDHSGGLIEALFDFKFNHDQRLLFVFLTLLIIGIVAIFSASIIFADRFTGNKYYFLFNHLKFIALGFIGLTFFYFVKPYIFVRAWFLFLFISIALLGFLVLLALLGKANVIDGANRWIELAGFQFQPSDFAKLSFVLFVAAFLSNKQNHYKDFSEYLKLNFIPYCFWFFLILLLILLGKNLGTAMVIGFIGITCYGVSITTKYHKIGFAILLGCMVIGGVLFGLVESYRADRIAVWTNFLKTGDTAMVSPETGTLTRDGKSYQFDQVLTSLGTGGLTGVGPGQSTGKYYYVKTTAGDDSIIGIIGEEWGFVVTSGILLLYLYLVLTCISIAHDFVDKPIYFFLMVGCSSWIGFQAFVHIGANVGVIPLTGQTLPFISLGGSSLFCLMCAMGLILNVSKQREETKLAVGKNLKL